VPRLRRCSCLEPGYSRQRRGRGVGYLDTAGHRIKDEETLARIRALAIPPAWTDVWICPDPNGHLQAVGVDSKGRRQYLYHEVWRQRKDREKFSRMLDFAALLPKLRHHYRQALEGTHLDRDRLLAGAVALVDLGLFRIGSPSYARDNGTFGVCTIERRHVRVRDDRAVFTFPAKGGTNWHVEVAEPDVVRLLAELKARRGTGPRLLVARTAKGWHPVQPVEVNRFIKEKVGSEFSAKDFRTWNATVAAAVALADRVDGTPPSARAARSLVKSAMEEVAETLGNTAAVARRAYVDPRVVDRFVEGRTIDELIVLAQRGKGERRHRDAALRHEPDRPVVEDAVLQLLRED
jgi:DNA topoisomerase IB